MGIYWRTMSKIIYKKMSLFSAPKGSFLAHGCNCQGIWGSGIAKEFKERFPTSLEEYSDYCKDRKFRPSALGYSSITSENIICLMTSNSYGRFVDKPHEILVNTTLALQCLIYDLTDLMKQDITIYSNKFNSGLFNVPWEQTEYALNRV